MRRMILLPLLLASGCALPVATPGVTRVNQVGQPVEPLAGVSFTALSVQNTRYAGGVGVPQGAVATATAPVPAPAASAPAPSGYAPEPGGIPVKGIPLPPGQPEGLFSGNMNGGYYNFGPNYGNGTPTALVSITQAEVAGSAGPYRQMMAAVVAPVIKAWAADAQLITSNGTTGSDGLLSGASPSPAPSCMPYYYGPDQQQAWTLVYYSAGRQEMLNFVVTSGKTTIIRTRWAPLDLAATPIGVDNDEATKALVTAIQTKGFKSEEEKTGKDYFLGSPYANNADCYGPPSTGPNRSEALYEVPADARWNASLQMMLGKPVWQLNFYSYKPNDTSSQGYYLNNSANGLVDASTGAVIRFGRPSKQYFATPVPFTPMPGMPVPMQVSPPPFQPTPAPASTTPPPAVAPSP